MFIKNDAERRWVNGTLGKIISLKNGELKIKIDGSEIEYDILPVIWEKVEYKWDRKKEEIEKIITGTYQQFPIKLAWSVTIHKSQGQTFKNVIIDLGGGAFETGQTYVALSRCETLEGIKLKRPVSLTDIKYDRKIGDYLDLKLNDQMTQERYQAIIEGLQAQLAILEPQNEHLLVRVKEAEQIVIKVKAEAEQTISRSRAEIRALTTQLSSKNKELESFKIELQSIAFSMEAKKRLQGLLKFSLFILAIAVGVIIALLLKLNNLSNLLLHNQH
jgi:hypothetical protein